MRIKGMDKITSKLGRQTLIVQKHSPVIMFGVGIAGVVTTVVLASCATLKMHEILEEGEKNSAEIKAAEALDTDQYDEKDASKDRATVRIKTAVKITKLYAPAFAVGVLSIAALTGSHIVLSRRNVALTSAYAAVDRGWREYRRRVVEELGPEKDLEFRYGTVEREVAVDTDDGVAVKTEKFLDLAGNDAAGYSIYAKLFSRETSRNWDPHKGYNAMFISSQQQFANDKLRADGHVFLNDVYDMLGLERTPAGQIVGWVKNNPDKDVDDFIDFGVFEGDRFTSMNFVKGDEPNIWLDFNVQGSIWKMI